MGENNISGQFYLEAIEKFIRSNNENYASMTKANFARLFLSSDKTTQEKLRKLWTEKGFDPISLNKIVDELNEQE
ncbi:MAG: hypothetical protein LBC70_09420 [Chitinispirillales bacterium]|jgi:hypothetical protein|nr:hypothetical protein [Chitinispirillales bacterium]